MKASLQQQEVFCLENISTTVGLLQQKEKSTQRNTEVITIGVISILHFTIKT